MLDALYRLEQRFGELAPVAIAELRRGIDALERIGDELARINEQGVIEGTGTLVNDDEPAEADSPKIAG